jgi:hypothetical protein
MRRARADVDSRLGQPIVDGQFIPRNKRKFGAGAYPSSPLTNVYQVLAVADPRSLLLAGRLRF